VERDITDLSEICLDVVNGSLTLPDGGGEGAFAKVIIMVCEKHK
jgi:hypothetical protein